MKRLLQWFRANAAVIAAASALAALGGPSVREAATAISAVAETLAAQPIEGE